MNNNINKVEGLNHQKEIRIRYLYTILRNEEQENELKGLEGDIIK